MDLRPSLRKQDNKNTITRDCPENNQTSGEIRGSEWSTKEPDIEKDSLHDEEMARDHNGVGRGIGFKSHSLSNQGGQRGVGHSEYVQKVSSRFSKQPCNNIMLSIADTDYQTL